MLATRERSGGWSLFLMGNSRPKTRIRRIFVNLFLALGIFGMAVSDFVLIEKASLWVV